MKARVLYLYIRRNLRFTDIASYVNFVIVIFSLFEIAEVWEKKRNM